MVFKPDWSVNVANVTVVVLAIMGGIGAWYNIKAQTEANTKDIIEIKAETAAHKLLDVAADLRQDQKREDSIKELKSTMKDNKDEIKNDVRELGRDLKSDIARIKK